MDLPILGAFDAKQIPFSSSAHNPAFAKKVGVPQAVAREFNKADAKTGILRKKKPKGSK